MPLLRLLGGLGMVLAGCGMYFIGMLFVIGDPEDPGYGLAFGIFGLGGIYLPVLLCGVHLMFFGGTPSVRARAIMVGLLAFVVIAALLGMLPFLFVTPARGDAWDVVFGVLLMSGLFGWPMVLGLSRAVSGRED